MENYAIEPGGQNVGDWQSRDACTSPLERRDWDGLTRRASLLPGNVARPTGWTGLCSRKCTASFVDTSSAKSSITRQIEKDAILVRTEGTGINGAVWHFVASDRSGTIGADPRVLDLLEDNGINYVIHLP